MADLFHWWDLDLQASPAGDLLSVTGLVWGQQRVLRRLLTNPGAYIWEPTYGAGLASFIGTPGDAKTIKGIIRAQLALEAAVSATPQPTITVTPIAGGVNIIIVYVDSGSGQQTTLNFNVSP